MLDCRPLTFFWIAEFSDGSALPQFDPETGKENKADPDWLPSVPRQPPIAKDAVFVDKKLVRFGWYPFTIELAGKISETQGVVVIPTANPSHVVELKDGEKLIAYRTNAIKLSLHGGVSRGETVYVLGKVPGKVLHICEDGSVE
jgi:hypothetical protein